MTVAFDLFSAPAKPATLPAPAQRARPQPWPQVGASPAPIAPPAGPDDAAPPLLGVGRSVTGRRWCQRPYDERLALALAQGHGLPELLGRVLAARGIGLGEIDDFLAPTLRALMPDPSRLAGMDAAAARIARAIAEGEQVAVFGDYDVDGATSAALLARFLRAVGTEPRIYIPDRMTEGYGPNPTALARLHAEGATLLVTVDCGTVAFQSIGAAADLGLDVVVIDHHEAEPQLPPAVAVVNPHRLDDTSDCGGLCAAGVTFLAVVAVNRALREAGWYRDRPEPDLRRWLDLVALGTVCDVVPLSRLNRALVAQGLRVMARRGNPGLAALADGAGIKEMPTAYHLGFVLGPRLNAGGRLGRSELGARLLTTDDPAEAARLATALEACNAERRSVESAVLTAALDEVAGEVAGDEAAAGLVFVAGADWHPGVTGLVASRLVQRFHRPACVVALDPDGTGKGSGRSIPGVDLGAAVMAARQAGLLTSGGGHPMAAGFTVPGDRVDTLHRFLADRIAEGLTEVPSVPMLELDGGLSVRAATVSLVQGLGRLEPFGAGNAEPRFALADAHLVRADRLNGGHVRCVIGGLGGGRLKGIAFRAADGPLGDALLAAAGRPLHLAGTLRPDRWQGREDVQLIIEDAAFVAAGGGGGATSWSND